MAEQTLAWRGTGREPLKQEGVLAAANETQAWLLQWWWENYSRLNSHPVSFIDLGLTEKTKKWCKERGELIELPSYGLAMTDKGQIDPVLLSEWQFFYGKSDWDKRLLFFLKPFFFLQTPYRKTLWLDLDCEVRCSLNEIFDYLEDPGICVTLDLNLSSTQKKTIYNGGVIGFSQGHPLILEWAKRTYDQNAFFHSDQELLSHLIAIRNERISVLPSLYQWSHYHQDNGLARIVHWHGERGKKAIRDHA